MNIRSIKERATYLLEGCRPQFMRIMTIIMLIGIIPDIFNETNNTFLNLITLLINLLFLTWEHGIIVSTLKVVRNNAQSLNDQDIYVGFTRIKDLFSTYFLSSFVVYLLIYGISFILLMIFQSILSSYVNISWISTMLVTSPNDVIIYLIQVIKNTPALLFIFLIIVCLIIIAAILIICYVFAMPYLKEQYYMRAGQSLKESFSLMSGHVWDFIRLEFSFLGWMILTILIQSVIAELLSITPIFGSVIGAIVATIFSVYTYLPRYKLSQAIFFEELAYYRYEAYQNQQGDFYDVE